jgi:Xaa-Pro aminopeptidase
MKEESSNPIAGIKELGMVTQSEYRARRQALAAMLVPDSLTIIAAAPEVIRNGDAHYPFRQDSQFYYLTGMEEPESLLVITAAPNSQSILFSRPRSMQEEQWTGKRLGQEGALSILGMDLAHPMDKLALELPALLTNKSAVYYPLSNHALHQQIMQAIAALKTQVRRGVKAPVALQDVEPLLAEMRLFKSEAEIQLMRQVAAVSVEAHKRAMQACLHAQHEYQLEAELLYAFAQQGCTNVAYGSIVANGENACILHYTENNKPLRAGDLVLIDAGAEYKGYAADITRTFPVNGRFSKAQKSLYELVLKAQEEAIALIKPGLLWNAMQEKIVAVLTEGLVELGILQGKVSDLIAKEAYKPFYMHNSGHWLGLDVHDVGAYKKDNAWRPLEPSMVLTVEPGLYISPNTPKVDPSWWGLAVRIEDDVLVTAKGHEVLTADLPKDVDAIEALMRGG